MGTGEVHKFEIYDSDKVSTSGQFVGYVEEIGSPWMSGFTDPHGIGSDLNGNLYIGDAVTGPIYRVGCDGGTRDGDGTLFNSTFSWGLTNIDSYQNYIFANGNGTTNGNITVLDPCDGSVVGEVCLNGNNDGADWGMDVMPNGTIVVSYGWNWACLLYTSPSPRDPE